MRVQDRRALMRGVAGLLAGGGAAATAAAAPLSCRSGRTAASFDRVALRASLALEAGAAEACARLATQPGLDASVRRHLTVAAADTRAQLARLATRVGPQHSPCASAPAGLDGGQEWIATLHRRTLKRLRTDEARAAFAPVVATATYRAGLLRTLQAGGAPRRA